MTPTPEPMFLTFEEGIINVHDISTVTPYSGPEGSLDPKKSGVRVTFMSKGTQLDLAGQTIKGFESRLNGAVF